MKERSTPDFNFYQSANEDAAAIKAGFLVRQYEYGVIIGDLRKHAGKGSVQHYLLLGRRGSGKSTLLRRLQVEIDTDEKLTNSYIAINLAEEQANIYRLFDLLEEIVRELEYRGMDIGWPALQEKDPDAYSQELFSVIHEALKKENKKLVLLLDNIDRIFESLGEEASTLRAHLQNYGDIKIIGGSTKMTEHFWTYDKPFYEFFRVLQLKPLNSGEVKKLLLYWAEKYQIIELKDFVRNKPGQLETIRILTDGLPRTLQFFVNILLTQNQETGYDYLRLVMDKVTPLYQERLNNLPPSQRKIVLQMAFAWEAVGAKELALATRMENRVISAQLGQLIEKGVAEKIETKTKNHLYRLSERFFNLWLIFTQGGPQEKRRARYLSIFLENFYDKQELNEMAKKHWDAVSNNEIAADKAVLLTKAFSQSKYLKSTLRDRLIKQALNLPTISEALKKELPSTIMEIIVIINQMRKKAKWEEAIRLINTIEQQDGVKEWLLGITYLEKGEFSNSEEELLNSFEKKFPPSYETLGRLYLKTKIFDLAEKYLELSFEYGFVSSAYYLFLLYYSGNKNRDFIISYLKSKSGVLEAKLSNILPVLKVWTGNFEGLQDDLVRLIREKADLNFTFRELLVHHQVNLVHQLFIFEEYGPQLVEHFLPLYYVTQLLLREERTVLIKIPPELRDTVNDILIEIYSRRDFYYNTKEAEAFLRQNGELTGEGSVAADAK